MLLLVALLLYALSRTEDSFLPADPGVEPEPLETFPVKLMKIEQKRVHQMLQHT